MNGFLSRFFPGDRVKYSIIIPTVNQTRLLLDCIISIRKYEKDSNYEIIIVDDGSDESICKWIYKTFMRDENVKIHCCGDNHGFAHAVNKGLQLSSGDYLVIMNNDVQLIQPILHLYEKTFVKNSRIGIIGAKLLYPPGNEIQHAGLVRIPRSKAFVHANKHKDRYFPDANKSRYYITVTGALYGIRRKAWKQIGDWNERYFLSCEDTEYSLRAWNLGWRVFYNHEIEAIHFEGHTRGNTPEIKRQKGPVWQSKENETIEKFSADLDLYDLDKIDRIVRTCNGMKSTVKNRGSLSADSKRILVRRYAAWGDVILTTPIVRRIREIKGAKAVVDVLTGCPDVYKNNPYVNKVLPINADIGSYDNIIDLDMCYEDDPNRHVIDAYANKAFGTTKINKKTDLFISKDDTSKVSRFLTSMGLDGSNCVAVHMARTWKNRTWPEEKWKKTLSILISKGKTPIIVGARADFRPIMEGAYNLFGCLTIQEVAYLVSQCACFVANDSGLLHVAGTTDTPIVGIFTCAKGEYRMPFRDGCTIIRPKSSCYGCLHKHNKATSQVDCDYGTIKCLDEITPKKVAAACLSACRNLIALS